MLKKIIGVVVMCTAAHSAMAGWIMQAGTISSVGSTWDPASSATNHAFYVSVSGTGPCNGQTIWFPSVASNNPEVHKRNFTLATMAYLEKKKVYIYNYKDDTCSHASLIQVND